jgi:hypothetical protein
MAQPPVGHDREISLKTSRCSLMEDETSSLASILVLNTYYC